MSSRYLNEEMVASYGVTIVGIQRTKAELKRLSGAIESLRDTDYQPEIKASKGVRGQPRITALEARFGTSRGDKLAGGAKDIFSALVDQFEGRVQTAVQNAMSKAMTLGKKTQVETLKAAVTEKGLSGKPKGRKGPGRNDTGTMIRSVTNNVELSKTAATTLILGWHGWQRNRTKYFEYQERGTRGRASGQTAKALKRRVPPRKPGSRAGRGVPAANSLGAAIIPVREFLRRELKALK